MTPSTTPRETVKIFDRYGNQLAQFRASAPRSWVIGKEGRASLTLPTIKTEYVNSTILRPGNWLLVENSHLPYWVGVIDMPREWGYRTVTVYAYSPERVFSWRRGPLEETITGSAGAIFALLIERINSAEATILQAGEIWRGGIQRQETLHPNQLSQNLANIQLRSGEEYSFRPVVSDKGQLIVYCDWQSKLGYATDCPLVEGKKGGNIENTQNTLSEDGVIVNDLLGYGSGSTWTTRPNVPTLSSDTSRGDYGLRQGSQDWGSANDVATITANNISYLSFNSQPQKVYGVTALNRGDTFFYMRLGNTLKLQLQSVGFTGDSIGIESRVRILGMGYDPKSGQKLQLALQEIL